MTVIMPFGRIATRFTARTSALFTRCNTSTSSIYASHQHVRDGISSTGFGDAGSSRSFTSTVVVREEASTPIPVSKPKAHTGRAKASTTKKSPTKTTTKTSAASDGTPKSKPKAKPKSKLEKVAKKAIPKGKKTAKQPSKNAILVAGRKERAELKAKAMLNEPKRLPQTAWSIYFSESVPRGIAAGQISSIVKEKAVQYKTLSPEEHERLNHIAVQNAKKNEEMLKDWTSQLTPLQILEANNARREIARIKNEAKPPTKQSPQVHLIKDDRLVTRPRNAFALFNVDRWASGDLKGLKLADASKLVGKEWKALAPTEKQEYVSRAVEDRQRFEQQKAETYGTAAAPNMRRGRRTKKTSPPPST